eukprot:851219-Prorocentrum_lima.AAC.1
MAPPERRPFAAASWRIGRFSSSPTAAPTSCCSGGARRTRSSRKGAEVRETAPERHGRPA